MYQSLAEVEWPVESRSKVGDVLHCVAWHSVNNAVLHAVVGEMCDADMHSSQKDGYDKHVVLFHWRMHIFDDGGGCGVARSVHAGRSRFVLEGVMPGAVMHALYAFTDCPTTRMCM